MDTRTKLGLLLGILAIIAIGVALAGCMQTIHGLSSDIRSAATYVEGHTIDDK